MAFPTDLGTLTSRRLRDWAGHRPALIVAVGSTEQHGPHLPLDTDTQIAGAVARCATDELGPEWLLAPALNYGASGEHEGFPGTVSIGTAALQLLLVEYGRSACGWASRIVFVNGHGGNVEALAQATMLLRSEGRNATWCPCSVADGDLHAGHTETSVLLHLSPADVHLADAVAGNTAPLAELLPAMRSGGVSAVSAVGVLGDPTTATAADGAVLFADMVEGCVSRILSWTPDGHGMLT